MANVTFVPADVLLFCIGDTCFKQGDSVVLVDGHWDGNAVCGNEACAAQALADFGKYSNPTPWNETADDEEPQP